MQEGIVFSKVDPLPAQSGDHQPAQMDSVPRARSGHHYSCYALGNGLSMENRRNFQRKCIYSLGINLITGRLSFSAFARSIHFRFPPPPPPPALACLRRALPTLLFFLLPGAFALQNENTASLKLWNASGRRSANSPLDHPAVRAPFLEAGLETGHVVDAVLCVGLEAALLATEAEFFVFELSLSDAPVTM